MLDPFLTLLSFEVHYWIKDRRFGKSVDVMHRSIDDCDVIMALYTKEKKIEGKEEYDPPINVIHELGWARQRNKLILCEKGTKIETMSFPEVPCIPFVREAYSRLLVDLLRFFKKSDMLITRTQTM